jgi:hypothetical protein
MSGASIDPEIETASVQYFPNRAPIVKPSLSQDVTDMLKDKIQSDTDLYLVNGAGDVNFEGVITDFSTKAMSITSNDRAAKNRFSISIKASYSNTVNPDNDFESTFTRYVDYDSDKTFEQAQDEFTPELLDLIVEDIFNKAFVNW